MDIMKDLSLMNYVAVSILEHLGVDLSHKQIDIIELRVLMATCTLAVDAKAIKQCVGGDNWLRELHKKVAEGYCNH